MPSQVAITRKIEFDSGHRIPDHKSKCKNLHGHRYVLEATVQGPKQNVPGESDHGMVVDFGDLKEIMMAEIGEPWDHSFLVYNRDPVLLMIRDALPDHKTVELEFVPTVENLVEYCTNLLAHRINELPTNFKLVHVRLYETPNCWADQYCNR